MLQLIFLELQFGMNRNYAKQLRNCQKTQTSQTFVHMDMFQKKIRKKPQYGQEQINSQMKMRQINSFWKQNWQYEHFHPIFINPVSISPTVVIEDALKQAKTRQANLLNDYNRVISTFFNRIKSQSDDQNSYKINSEPYLSAEQCFSMQQYHKCQKIIKQSLNNGLLFVQNMKKSIQALPIEQSEDYVHDYFQVIQPVIQFCRLNFIKLLSSQENQVRNEMNQEVDGFSSFKQLTRFCIQLKRCIDQTINQKNPRSSTLFTVQPQIKSFTYIVHPVLKAVQLFIKQKQLAIAQIRQKIRRRRLNMQSGVEDTQIIHLAQLKKNSKQDGLAILIERHYRNLQAQADQQFPKVLILNFDGYQSQFNIQHARKLNQNLMYVSFPKETNRSLQHSKRFLKKFMPTYSRQTCQQIQEQSLAMKQNIQNNPENYYQHLETFLLKDNPHYNRDKMNQNLFIFPLNSQAMREKWSQLNIAQQNVQIFQSHLIRGIFRNYIVPEIKKFSPSVTIVSFTGRLNTEEKHLIEMLRELTKLSNMKIIFFPNLTTLFCPQLQQQLSQYSKQIEHEIDYQYIQDPSINFQERQPYFQMMGEQETTTDTDFLGTLSKFLKISSGTYNLSLNFQQEPIADKYKNSKAFQYTNVLFQILGKQYNRIKQIKPQSRSNFHYQFYKQALEDQIIQKGVPLYYKNLYSVFQHLLFQQNTTNILKKQRVNPHQYADLVRQIKQVRKNSQASCFDFDKQGKSFFYEQKKIKFLQLASKKYQERLNIYIKDTVQNQYFNSGPEDKTEQMNSLVGIYFLSFFDEHRENIRIDENTNILYKQNQKNSQYFHVFLMNNNSFQQPNLKNHVTLVKKSSTYYKFQRCQTQEVIFTDQHGMAIQSNPYKINTNWNYAETNDHIILFWPSQFDLIREIGYTMIGKKYEPIVLNQIFVAKKMKKQLNGKMLFKRVNYITQTKDQIQPRVGVSVYQDFNKLFLFGGFYGKDKNYLNLQHDITTFDMNNFDLQTNPKVVLENDKMQLYCQSRISFASEKNSFVRARTQYSFYEKSELSSKTETDINQSEDQKQNQNQKTIIIIGGYGQNFVRPFSLLTNYYYQVKFNLQTRKVSSIEKKWIYNRTVPINIRGMMKNKGFYQKMNVFDEGDQMIKISSATPSHYLFHRIAYQFDKQGNLDYRIKTFYAIQQYSITKSEFVELAKKLGELRPINQSSQINLVEISHTKNYIVVSQGKRKFVVGIYYQTADASNRTQVKLTNQNLISIDINGNKVFALIKHPCYTQDKSVLAICDIVFPQYEITQEEIYNIPQKVVPIVLKPVQYFNNDLSMHTIIACNKKLVLILHGALLRESCLIKEYAIKIKHLPQKKIHQAALKLNISPIYFQQSPKQFCQSFFIKKDMKVQCYNFFSDKNNTQILHMKSQMMSIGQLKYQWHTQQNLDFSFIFFIQQDQMQAISISPKIIQVRKNLKDQLLCRIRHKQQQFKGRLSGQGYVQFKGKKVIKVRLERQLRNTQWQESQSGKAISKSTKQYEDID